MTIDEAIKLVRERWDAEGECKSCGWHAALSEYDLPEDITINVPKGRLELPCFSKNDDGSWNHRGVRIAIPRDADREPDAHG